MSFTIADKVTALDAELDADGNCAELEIKVIEDTTAPPLPLLDPLPLELPLPEPLLELELELELLLDVVPPEEPVPIVLEPPPLHAASRTLKKTAAPDLRIV
ncbi:MAG: hypothetical protein P4L83_04825 [Nevskia sp.]|nr:hypothetical protein [Nevskia sp.]